MFSSGTVADVSSRRRSSRSLPLEMSDLRIVLLGKCVSENSSVGNFILGQAAFNDEALPDVVERVGGKVKDRHVTVINCPRLLQTNNSDHHLTQTVRKCAYLSHPGPHVIILVLNPNQCSAEDEECVKKVLDAFTERGFQHTMVLSTEVTNENNHILQKIIQKCFSRHFILQRSSSPDGLLQTFEDIVLKNAGHHLVCAEGSEYFTTNQQARARLFTMVLFTRGDDLKDKTIDQVLGTPGSSLMNFLKACGNRYHVFNNNIQTGNRTQVTELLEKIDNMVAANGGSFYSCKMFRQMEREKQEKERKILIETVEQLNREREELMKKLEEEKEKMKVMIEEERKNHDKEIKKREEECREIEERYKRELKEQEMQMKDEMKKEREIFRNEVKDRRREKDNLQEKYDKEIDRMMNRIESDRQYHEKERERKENQITEREEQYKIEMRREREHWEVQKLEEQMRREEEDEKLKQALDERYQRLRSQMEEIIKEKDRIERERLRQLEDFGKRKMLNELNEESQC